MTGGEMVSKVKPTSAIFVECFNQLEQQDSRKADQLWRELQYHLGKSAIAQNLSLVEVIAREIDQRVILWSGDHRETSESYIAFLFSPDSGGGEITACGFMRRLVLNERP